MTNFDKTLIEKARRFGIRQWREIAILVSIADTDEARERLKDISWELYDLCKETV